MEELKDIKGLMEIPDYSLYVLIFLCFLVLIILAFVIKKIVTYKRKPSLKKLAKLELANIDLEDSKECAYKLENILKTLEASSDIVEKLQKYKYKKEKLPLSEEEKEEILKLKAQYAV